MRVFAEMPCDCATQIETDLNHGGSALTSCSLQIERRSNVFHYSHLAHPISSKWLHLLTALSEWCTLLTHRCAEITINTTVGGNPICGISPHTLTARNNSLHLSFAYYRFGIGNIYQHVFFSGILFISFVIVLY